MGCHRITSSRFDHMSDCVSHGFDSIALSETCACAQDRVRCVRASVRVCECKRSRMSLVTFSHTVAHVVTFSPH